MPSIFPGFEYDIFISYRHNDNRSGWVTEFVKSLQEELAATIKEPVSIYFDANPHDGLLETHNVDKSLEGKLKCLIFIPIISQTYCDTNSFAWQHEFVAFNKLTKEDQFGRDIKLNNGNVASRILPIKIHDLDAEDKSLLESEMGGVLRAIDFIFKSAGVNRSLRAVEEHAQDNLNKTFYRDQINKAANSIKEIITSLKNPVAQTSKITTNQQPAAKPARNRKVKLASFASLILIVLIGYWLYPKLFPSADKVVLGKSIAVLPFVNMSNDPEQEYFSDGISEELLNLLAKVPELRVIGRTSSFYFKGKNEDLRVIGEKLGVTYLLEGSVRKDGNKIRITAQLIRSDDGSHLWSETYERELDSFFALQDDISRSVVDALKLTLIGKADSTLTKINSAAYSLFLQGRFYFESTPNDSEENNKAIDYFKKTIEMDSTFSLPWAYLSGCFMKKTSSSLSAQFLESKNAAQEALRLDPHSVRSLISIVDIAIAEYDLRKAKENIDEALGLEPNDPYVLRNACNVYTEVGQFDKAIEYGRRSLRNDPYNFSAQLYLYDAYGLALRDKESLDLISQVQAQGNPQLTMASYEYRSNLMLIDAGKAKEVISKTKDTDYFLKAMAYMSLGMKEEADKAIKQLTLYQRGYQLARIYSFGEDQEEVKKWLEYSYAHRERSFTRIVSNQRFQKYRDAPWFKELLKKIKLPE